MHLSWEQTSADGAPVPCTTVPVDAILILASEPQPARPLPSKMLQRLFLLLIELGPMGKSAVWEPAFVEDMIVVAQFTRF